MTRLLGTWSGQLERPAGLRRTFKGRAMKAWVWLGVAVVLGVLLAAVAPVTVGETVFPYRAPSLCSGRPCEAVGVLVELPNGLLGVQVLGPAPGVEFNPR